MEPEPSRTDEVTRITRDMVAETDGSTWLSLWENLRDALIPARQPPLLLNSRPVDTTDVHAVIEEPIWKTLWNSVRDIFFHPKLPPLELTSTPIAVENRMEVKRSPVSSAVAAAAHLVVIVLLLLSGMAEWHVRVIPKQATVIPITPFIPAAPARITMGGGGGGGNHEIVAPSKGRLPKMMKHPMSPPQILRLDHPKLPVEPAAAMMQPLKLPDVANMPNLGIPQSPQVALSSQGQGDGSGFGSGSGGGLGSGHGSGIGPGEGGNYGGGVMHVGGGVSEPELIYAPDPQFSDQARRAKYQGVCVVGLIVDAQGNPQNIHIVHPLGMGLDEKAMEAVRRYKFKPAIYQGHPVPVAIDVEVNFRIY